MSIGLYNVYIIIKNPADGITIKQSTKPDKIKFLTTDQQIALFETLDEPRSRVFCGLCMYADLRREEALGLMWTDIEDGKLTVRRATTFIRNQPDEDTSLKTKAAARTIPIPQVLQDILDDTPRRALYIVPPARDQIMTQSAFSRMWLHHVTNLVDFAVRPHMHAPSHLRINITRGRSRSQDCTVPDGAQQYLRDGQYYTHLDTQLTA